MTLYNLIREISDIITPGTNEFYEYVLHNCDDNGGFLRTRYCYWERSVDDREIPEIKQTVVCYRTEFDPSNPCFTKNGSRIEIQLFYNAKDDIWDNIEISSQLGFCTAYIIDIEERKYSVTNFEPGLT